MADEQEMIRRILSNSLSGIIRDLTSETLTFDRIDSLQYRVDWLYHTTVRYLDTGIIDARIVRCLREAREFLYGSRSGGLPHRANSSTTNIYWCKRKTLFNVIFLLNDIFEVSPLDECCYSWGKLACKICLNKNKTKKEDRCLIYPKNSWNFLQRKGSLLKKAQLFGVSKRTVERRSSEFGLSLRGNYAHLLSFNTKPSSFNM